MVFQKPICLIIALSLAFSCFAASYIGDPNALNGWDSSSAITVTDSNIYGDFLKVNIYNLVDGSGIDPNGQLHSNLFEIEPNIFDEMCYLADSPPIAYDTYDPNINATGKVWVAFEFDAVYSLNKMLVWNFNWYSYENPDLPVSKSHWGMKDVTIAYSVDKDTWNEFDYQLAEAPSGLAWNDGDPTKCPVTDEIYFVGANAKYVVIMAHSNHGGSNYDKYGLSEVRFEIYEEPNPCEGLLMGDLDVDCDVDFADLGIFTTQWLDSICETSNCEGDLDNDNDVDSIDYALLTKNMFKDATYTLNTDDTTVHFQVYPNDIFINKLANTTENYNWIAGNIPITLPTTAWVGESNYPLDWQVQDINSQTGVDVNTITITFANQTPPLEAKSIWTAHPGPGPIQHRIEITNTDTQAVQIDYTPSLDLDLTLPQETVKHWWVEKGAGNPSDLGTNITTINSTFSYLGVCTPYDNSDELNNSVSNEPVPWQCIHAITSQHGLYTGIESTACIMQKAIMNPGPNTLNLALGVDETISTFRTELQPSEVFEFPPVFIGCFAGEVDDGSNRLRRWVESWLLPDSDDANLPLLVNNSWGKGLPGATEPVAMDMINECNSLGMEMFHLDAGWYQKITTYIGTYHRVGYWYPYLTYLPNGIWPVSNHAHTKGVRFGLWCAWALGNNLQEGDADPNVANGEVLSINGPGMSDWFSSPGPETSGSWDFSANYDGAVACLSYQPARDWIINDMQRCITEYGLDHLEHDRRVVAQTCNETNHGHLNNSGDISIRCAKAYYEILDTFRNDYPGIILENCVMGGRMLDYGLIQHTHYSCVGDDYDPMSLRQGFYDTSHAMPARILEGYIGQGGLDESIPLLHYYLRSAMLGWCTIMMDTSDSETGWTAAQRNDAKNQFSVYKEKIRPQIRNGDLYHLTNRPSPTSWDAYEYYTPATGKGVVFVFRSEQSNHGAPIIFLKGLDPNAYYDVSFQDGDDPFGEDPQTGQYLMQTGVMVPLGYQPSSELVYIEEQ